MNITELARRYVIAVSEGWATQSQILMDSAALPLATQEEISELMLANHNKWVAECRQRKRSLDKVLREHGMTLADADKYTAECPMTGCPDSMPEIIKQFDDIMYRVREKEWSIKYSEEWPPYQ